MLCNVPVNKHKGKIRSGLYVQGKGTARGGVCIGFRVQGSPFTFSPGGSKGLSNHSLDTLVITIYKNHLGLKLAKIKSPKAREILGFRGQGLGLGFKPLQKPISCEHISYPSICVQLKCVLLLLDMLEDFIHKQCPSHHTVK